MKHVFKELTADRGFIQCSLELSPSGVGKELKSGVIQMKKMYVELFERL